MEAHELLSKFYHHLLLKYKGRSGSTGIFACQGLYNGKYHEIPNRLVASKLGFHSQVSGKEGISPLNLWKRRASRQKGKGSIPSSIGSGEESCFRSMDTKGNTVAFSGRSIKTDDEPKYLNSPETKIFNKSKILYHYHGARA